MDHLAATVNEKTLFGRVGGAATLAAGMAQYLLGRDRRAGGWTCGITSPSCSRRCSSSRPLMPARAWGATCCTISWAAIWKPLGDTKNLGANMLASGLLVAGWGYFLIQGVRDPLGGVNSLWPLFGIANQMLAAIGLCLGTTVILKMTLPATRPRSVQDAPDAGQAGAGAHHAGSAGLAAGGDDDGGRAEDLAPGPAHRVPGAGASLNEKLPALEEAVAAAKAGGRRTPSPQPRRRATPTACSISTTSWMRSWRRRFWRW